MLPQALRETIMAAQVLGVDGGQLTVQISGRLLQSDLIALQKQVAAEIDRHGDLRILVLTDQFEGWEREGAWNDFSFQEGYDERIRAMAIVGEEQWRDLALLFTSQGLRRFPIEFFGAPRRAQAERWLAAAAA